MAGRGGFVNGGIGAGRGGFVNGGRSNFHDLRSEINDVRQDFEAKRQDMLREIENLEVRIMQHEEAMETEFAGIRYSLNIAKEKINQLVRLCNDAYKVAVQTTFALFHYHLMPWPGGNRVPLYPTDVPMNQRQLGDNETLPLRDYVEEITIPF